jgi:hypothetical protein
MQQKSFFLRIVCFNVFTSSGLPFFRTRGEKVLLSTLIFLVCSHGTFSPRISFSLGKPTFTFRVASPRATTNSLFVDCLANTVMEKTRQHLQTTSLWNEHHESSQRIREYTSSVQKFLVQLLSLPTEKRELRSPLQKRLWMWCNSGMRFPLL